MRRMPRKIRVGPHVYEVLRPDMMKHSETEIDGLCDTDKLEIKVGAGMKLSRAQETLLHEILHTTTKGTAIPLEHEEDIIERIAPALLQIFHDNPGLLEYLRQREPK